MKYLRLNHWFACIILPFSKIHQDEDGGSYEGGWGMRGGVGCYSRRIDMGGESTQKH